MLGWIPVLGEVLTMLAAVAGSGAVVLAAWRGGRGYPTVLASVPGEPRLVAEALEPSPV